MLDVLNHKLNTLITTAADGSVFLKIFMNITWKTLEDLIFIYSGIGNYCNDEIIFNTKTHF